MDCNNSDQMACETILDNNRLLLSEVEIGKSLPEWKLDTIFGDEVPSVASFKGQPLLILFFSLDCPGCLGRAIPYANRILYEQGENMKVVGIHSYMGSKKIEVEKFEKAKEEFYMRFPFYADHNYDTTFLRYGAGGTPHWILVDGDGVVQYHIFGSDPNNALLRLDYMIGETLLKNSEIL